MLRILCYIVYYIYGVISWFWIVIYYGELGSVGVEFGVLILMYS